MRTLVFDQLNSTLSKALAKAWNNQGDCVINASLKGGISAALADISAPYGVIFSESTLDEAALLNIATADLDMAVNFSESIQNQLLEFLTNCRAATQAMMPSKKGHVLVLCTDDVSSSMIGLPESPVINQARASAIKSLSKEYSRMGIHYNTVVYQPSKEMVEKSVWRANQEAMKVYALRYTPIATENYVNHLLSILNSSPAAVNGGLICLGNGIMEMGS